MIPLFLPSLLWKKAHNSSWQNWAEILPLAFHQRRIEGKSSTEFSSEIGCQSWGANDRSGRYLPQTGDLPSRYSLPQRQTHLKIDAFPFRGHPFAPGLFLCRRRTEQSSLHSRRLSLCWTRTRSCWNRPAIHLPAADGRLGISWGAREGVAHQFFIVPAVHGTSVPLRLSMTVVFITCMCYLFGASWATWAHLG